MPFCVGHTLGKWMLKSSSQKRHCRGGAAKTDNDINEASKEKSKNLSSYYALVPKSHSKQSSFKTLTHTNPCSPMKFGIRAFSSAKQQTSISFMCSLNSFLLLFPNSAKERRSSKTDNDINEARKEKAKISLLITLSSPNPTLSKVLLKHSNKSLQSHEVWHPSVFLSKAADVHLFLCVP
ncbi:hypothetical protein CEXT_487661 [Caerostris extrusa]|uniref:Uncharacterized protein n=1 Tax=Caerostris extrusa TaxID=172846 RepID=A0AAV4QBH8_CAEEX|nr:hypothetical protein CEXT_487661 [Caerostris extrusa]